ncbi:hypothetical protein, partial [Flavonifractor sp. An4]|uniref:hypothetical protein n=1 Tax=Flavonifractor sp. An4 TaxID=1965634 RepID=UPI000B36EA7C
PTPTPEPPQWGEQVFTQTYTAGDGTQVMTVRYTLPMVQNTDTCPAGDVINDWYKADGASRMESAEANYEQVVADYDVSKAAGFSFTPVTEEMSYEVVLSTDQVISIRRTWYINSGAAYPTVFELGENFDPQTGIKLTFTDFFTDAQAVRDRVVKAFLASPELSAGEFTQAAVTAAYQPEQFCLTSDGYVFWIQGNTLTGIHSPVEVTIPYDTLKDVSMYAAQ